MRVGCELTPRHKCLEERRDVAQRSEDGLASGEDLENEAEERNHGQTAVLEFLELVLFKFVGLAEVERVETEVGARRVGGLKGS